MKGQILIVDDQLGIRLLLTDIFTSEGYEVITAETGQEALEKIKKYAFDLMILDHSLPIYDGQEVLRQMRTDEIKVPVILMSGFVDHLKQELLKDDLVIEIVTKPFDIKNMSKIVQTAIIN